MGFVESFFHLCETLISWNQMKGLFGVGKSTFPSRQFLKKRASVKVLRMHRNKFKYKEKLDGPSKVGNALNHCAWTLGLGSQNLRKDPCNKSFCLALHWMRRTTFLVSVLVSLFFFSESSSLKQHHVSVLVHGQQHHHRFELPT